LEVNFHLSFAHRGLHRVFFSISPFMTFTTQTHDKLKGRILRAGSGKEKAQALAAVDPSCWWCSLRKKDIPCFPLSSFFSSTPYSSIPCSSVQKLSEHRAWFSDCCLGCACLYACLESSLRVCIFHVTWC
jgi:hypothetical protein